MIRQRVHALFFAVVVVASCGGKSDSSTGIPGPPIGPVKYGTLDPAKAMRAAVFLGSCIPDDRSNRLLNVMYSERAGDLGDARFTRGQVDCFAGKSNGCQAVADCVAIVVDNAGPCERHCDGSVYTACDDEMRFRVDCGRYTGFTCNGNDCALPIEACDPTTFKPSCDGGVPTNCTSASKGIRRGARCADFGLVCGSLPSGTMGCLGSEGACTATTFSTSAVRFEGLGCGGTSLQACVNGGKTTLDCSTVGTGFSCQTVPGSTKSSFFCGLAAECDPTNTSSRPTCDGSSLVVCNAGKIEKVDCKSLGFTGCNATAGVCSPSPW
jgi:hypothetical protein